MDDILDDTGVSKLSAEVFFFSKVNYSFKFNVYDRLCCLSNVKLSWQRHWQVMMYWFMSRCH